MIKGVEMGEQTSEQIALDIVEVSGRTVENVKMLGLLPERCYQGGEDFNVYVRWTADGTVRADRSDTDSMIVAESTLNGKIKGFGRLMQSLADHYGVTVVVRTDPGVSGGQSGKLTGTWEPTVTVTPVTSTTAESRVQAYAAKHKLTNQADLSLMVDELTAVEAEVMAAVDAVKAYGKVWASEADRTGLPVEAFDLAVSRGLLAVYGRNTMRRFMLPYQAWTVDGVEITDGLAVWDYNINPGTVDLSALGDDGWFHVQTADGGYSLMNAERVVTRHPRTRQLAADALVEVPFPAEGDTFYRDRDGATGIVTNVDRYQVTVALANGTQVTEYVKTLIEQGYEHIPAAEVKAGEHATTVDPIPSQDCKPAPVKTFSDRDMRDQIVEYLNMLVNDFYVDGIIDELISLHNGAVDIDTIDENLFIKVIDKHARTSGDTMAGLVAEVTCDQAETVDSPCVHCGQSASTGRDDRVTPYPHECVSREELDRHNARMAELEAEIWAGTGTLIIPAVKRPVRAKLAKRSRKSARRARRGIKGGC